MTTDNETLSSFWRRRRSTDRPIALRDLQNELSYLARMILNDQNVSVAWHQTLAENPNAGSLVQSQFDWRGRPQAINTPTTLIIDSTPIGDVPEGWAIPDNRVDTLVGDTIYRSHLEKLERDAVYGALFQEYKSLADVVKPGTLIDRQRRTFAALRHWKAWYNGLDSPPAIRSYVDTSRQWKKEHILPLSQELVERCKADEVAYEDAVDLWTLYLNYNIDLDAEINSDVLDSMIEATRKVYKIVSMPARNWNWLRSQVDDVSTVFDGFRFRKDIPPPPQPMPEPGDEDEGEEGDDPDAEEGSGDQSPDGTDKENEGEPPEGGPGSEEGDSEDSDEEDKDDSESSELPGDDDQESEPDSSRSDSSESLEEEGTEDQVDDDDSDGDEDSDEGLDDEAGESDSEPDGSDSQGDDDEEDSDDDEEDESESGQSDMGSDSTGSDPGMAEDGDSDEESGDEELEPLDRIRQEAQSQPLVDLLDQIDTISDEEAEEIRQSIEFAREDITDDLESLDIKGGRGGNSVIWEKAIYDQALEVQLRTKAYVNATGVTQILHRFKRAKSRVEHGQEIGYKIDKRRVGRILYGDVRVFERRSIIDKLDMCLVILMDSSGSISDEQWKLMQETAASFVQATQGRDDIEMMVVSYTTNYDYGSGGTTNIVRHYDRRLGRFHATRKYSGGTPSQIGLAAIRESIFKRLNITKKDKIVIHLTDGAPDSEEDVKEQVRLNKEAGIQTYCILIEGQSYYRRFQPVVSNDDNFKDTYGAKNFIHLLGFDRLLKCLIDLFAGITEAR